MLNFGELWISHLHKNVNTVTDQMFKGKQTQL
jgi:hypothetical protein